LGNNLAAFVMMIALSIVPLLKKTRPQHRGRVMRTNKKTAGVGARLRLSSRIRKGNQSVGALRQGTSAPEPDFGCVQMIEMMLKAFMIIKLRLPFSRCCQSTSLKCGCQ
jgi:hypothetical protein